MSALDDRIRDELLTHVRQLAGAAVGRFENARSQVDADNATTDMRQLKEWLDWLAAAGTGRGSRTS